MSDELWLGIVVLAGLSNWVMWGMMRRAQRSSGKTSRGGDANAVFAGIGYSPELIQKLIEDRCGERETLVARYLAAEGSRCFPHEIMICERTVGSVTTTWVQRRSDPIPKFEESKMGGYAT